MISSDWKIYKPVLEEFTESEEYYRCREAAIQYAAPRTRSTGALRKKLMEKSFSLDLIERIVEELDSEHYLHDQKIALSILKERRGGKAESHLALRQRLNRFGVKSQIIEESLSQHLDDTVLCTEFLKSKAIELIQSYDEANDYEQKQKLLAKIVRKAASRGFSYSIISTCLREYSNELE